MLLFCVFHVLFVWRVLQTYDRTVLYSRLCSWIPRLTLLDLETNWMYECALRTELVHMLRTYCNWKRNVPFNCLHIPFLSWSRLSFIRGVKASVYWGPTMCQVCATGKRFMCPCQGVFPTVLQIIRHRSILHMSKLRVRVLCLLGATEPVTGRTGLQSGVWYQWSVLHNIPSAILWTNKLQNERCHILQFFYDPSINSSSLFSKHLPCAMCYSQVLGIQLAPYQRVQHLKIEPTSDGKYLKINKENLRKFPKVKPGFARLVTSYMAFTTSYIVFVL